MVLIYIWLTNQHNVHLYLGCPLSCNCEEFGEGKDKRILITGEDLLTVPRNLPFNTGAV